MRNRLVTRILINATHTAETNFNTGIQRVVRRVAQCAQPLQTRLGIACIPVQCYRGRIFSVPRIAGRQSWDEQLTCDVRHGARRVLASIDAFVSSHWPAAGRGLRRLGMRTRKALYPRSLARAATIAMAAIRGREIKLRQGDIVLMLDTSWESGPALYELARQNGCYIAQVVYDLLPVTHPQFFSPDIVTNYSEWMLRAFEQVDCFWAISRTVRQELYQHYQQHPTSSPPLASDRFRSFRLGADLMPPDQQVQPRPSIQSIFGDGIPVFFSVGTLEPRKNHLWLISGFDRYWTDGGQAKLVLAGRAGWACSHIINRIENHPLYGTSLFWLKDASDNEVRYMYRRARATAYSSLAEGFGLPIVESLHQGTDVLASDTAIHREVGGDQIVYFSLDRLDDLVHKIGKLAKSPKRPPTTNQRLVPTWQESAEQLLSDVLHQADQTRQFREVGTADKAA